jgi:hypothetical protein
MNTPGSLARQVAWLRLYAARTLEQNAELRLRNCAIRGATAKTIENAGAARADSLRLKSAPQGPLAPPPADAFMTPRMLLELAVEFGELAARAETVESATAYHDLMFRYVALAGGYDTNAARSRYCH